MLIARLAAALFLLVAFNPGGYAASAQIYPSKPIRILSSEAGGGSDIIARLVAQGLAGSLGQQVIVENRGGASGAIQGEILAGATPDGYTLLSYGSTIWVVTLLHKTRYDPLRDFAPISLTVSMPDILVVHPAIPVDSVKALIAMAKARPGELNYGSGGTGTSSHLAAELFKSMASVNIMRISYKGGAQALNDLIAEQVQLMFPLAGSVKGHIKTGRVKALAVTSAQPSALAPGLPTIAAAGLPGYESIQTFGFFAPSRTPAAIINRLNAEIVRFLGRPEVREQLFNAGIETVGSTPAELAAAMKAELARLGKAIRQAGIHAD